MPSTFEESRAANKLAAESLKQTKDDVVEAGTTAPHDASTENADKARREGWNRPNDVQHPRG